MELRLPRLTIRHYRLEDAEALARHANHREVWRNMLDVFPHPYTLEEARRWLALVVQQPDSLTFALDVDGEAVGGIGLRTQTGNDRFTVILGYWLGHEYWGRGLATEAVRGLLDWAWERYPDWHRIQATVYGWNGASGRVLEKCGFALEGRLREAIFKDGQHTDSLFYGLLRPRG